MQTGRMTMYRYLFIAIFLGCLTIFPVQALSAPPVVNDPATDAIQDITLDKVYYNDPSNTINNGTTTFSHPPVNVEDANVAMSAEIKSVNVGAPAVSTDDYWYAARFKDFFNEKAVRNMVLIKIEPNGPGIELVYPEMYCMLQEGFWRGRYITPSMALQARVIDAVGGNYNTIAQFGMGDIQDIVVDNFTNFADYVVDLAIELDNGVFSFYYRIVDITVDTPETLMTKASGSWVLYNSYTLQPADGQPEGLSARAALRQGRMIDPLSYKATVDHSTFNDDKGVVVNVGDRERDALSSDADNNYGLGNFVATNCANQIIVQCDPGELIEFRYAMWGTRLTVGDSQIKKIKDPTTAIDFPRYIDPLVDTPQSGDWYVTEVNSADALAVDTLLDTGKFYHIYFYIEDNDPDFDLDPTDGIIKDPNVTGQISSGSTGSGGGGGGGCFIDTAAHGFRRAK